MTTDVWKMAFMQALNHEVQFEIGLNNKPFPVGYSSSRLTVPEMNDLIEYIYWYGAQHGVEFSENPNEANAA